MSSVRSSCAYGLGALAAVLALAGAGACTYDFDQFEGLAPPELNDAGAGRGGTAGTAKDASADGAAGSGASGGGGKSTGGSGGATGGSGGLGGSGGASGGNSGGSGTTGGSAGSGGASGATGSSGASGATGSGGASGATGSGGTAGKGGSAGAGGTAGTGAAGSKIADASTDGTGGGGSGSGGTGGSTGGSGGATGGTAGSSGTAGSGGTSTTDAAPDTRPTDVAVDPVDVRVDAAFDCAAVSGTVYEGHCYYAKSVAVDWNTASTTTCEAPAYLATITSAAEQAIVAALLPTQDRWIGLRRPTNSPKAESSFYWVTNEALSYRNWDTYSDADKEPNYTGECVRIRFTNMWADVACTEALAAVCEHD